MPTHRGSLEKGGMQHKPIIPVILGDVDGDLRIPMSALIDTGAEHSTAPKAILDRLKLSVLGKTEMFGHNNVSHGWVTCYRACITIASNDPPEGAMVIECNVCEGSSASTDMIIGMSALRTVKTTFFPGDQFTIQWDRPLPPAPQSSS